MFQASEDEDKRLHDSLALSSPSKILRNSLVVDTPTKPLSKRAGGKKRAGENNLEGRETVRMTRSRMAGHRLEEDTRYFFSLDFVLWLLRFHS